jgi:GGDEF domain-containing protein
MNELERRDPQDSRTLARQLLDGCAAPDAPRPSIVRQAIEQTGSNPADAASAWRLGWLQALQRVLDGEPEAARQHLARLRSSPPPRQASAPDTMNLAPENTELPLLWVALLIAQARQDAAALEAAALRLADEAARIGHQPLADLGERCLARCLDAEQLARRRQAQDGGDSPPAAARLSRYLAQLQAGALPALVPEHAEQRPALPDRQAFMQQAHRLLPLAGGQDCAVLLLSACDIEPTTPARHEHVLAAFAQLIGLTLRAGDLAARWSDAQIAVLLPQASADDAARICQRIAQAVQERDWSALSGDRLLQIDISHAQAGPDDTPQTLMQRCEAEMAAGRRRRRRIAA